MTALETEALARSLAEASGESIESVEAFVAESKIAHEVIEQQWFKLASEICQHCGVCCAYFRVSFYWTESLDRIDPNWVEPVNSVMACMKTASDPSFPDARRCVALEGELGKSVRCGIYENRPSPCKGVMPGDEKCAKARGKFALPPVRVELAQLIA